MLFRWRSRRRHFKTVRVHGQPEPLRLEARTRCRRPSPPEPWSGRRPLTPASRHVLRVSVAQRGPVARSSLSRKQLQMASSVGNVADSTGTGVPSTLADAPRGSRAALGLSLSPAFPLAIPMTSVALAELPVVYRHPIGFSAVVCSAHVASGSPALCCLSWFFSLPVALAAHCLGTPLSPVHA